jgi:hypothetical protein
MEHICVLFSVWLDLFLILTALPAAFKSFISLTEIAVLRPSPITREFILGVNEWKRRA